MYDSDGIKIARVGYSSRLGSLSVLREHYLIAERNKGIKHFEDLQYLLLFDMKKTLAIMRKARFKTKFLKKGISPARGLLIGIKQ
jgi:hypothetical protein